MATENSSRNLQLNSSLSVLFYVAVCFGALPYSPIEYRNNKLFQVSYITLGLSICSTIFNVAQYHFSTNMFTLSENKESQTSALTTIIGICILYMVPVMLVVDVIGFIINRKTLITALEGLQSVDEKLQRENITFDYRKQTMLTTMLTLFVTACEVSLNYFSFFLFRDTLIKGQWYIAFITTTFLMIPLYLTTVAKIWYIVLVYNVREKLNAINVHLLNTQKCISDLRLRINHGISGKNRIHKDDSVDLAGYLHKEIGLIKRTGQQVVKQLSSDDSVEKKKSKVKVGVVQVFPINDDSATINFQLKKNITNYIPNYEDLFTITNKSFSMADKMDRKLTTLCTIHDEICELGATINKMFSFQMLILMAYGFMAITAQFYFLYCGLMGQNIPPLFRSAGSLSYSLIFIIYTASKCVYVISISWRTKVDALKTGVQFHKIANVVDEDHCYQIINHLSLKLLNHKLNFTACGFFDLDMTTLYAITGAVTSYLIILIQFNLAAIRTRAKSNNSTIITSTTPEN